VLGIAGYQANQAQTPDALTAIHGMLTLAPIAIMVVLIVLTHLYKLDRANHAEIVAKLASEGSR
jgi:Na+/melibiose symporter-like transporter